MDGVRLMADVDRGQSLLPSNLVLDEGAAAHEAVEDGPRMVCEARVRAL